MRWRGWPSLDASRSLNRVHSRGGLHLVCSVNTEAAVDRSNAVSLASDSAGSNPDLWARRAGSYVGRSICGSADCSPATDASPGRPPPTFWERIRFCVDEDLPSESEETTYPIAAPFRSVTTASGQVNRLKRVVRTRFDTSTTTLCSRSVWCRGQGLLPEKLCPGRSDGHVQCRCQSASVNR